MNRLIIAVVILFLSGSVSAGYNDNIKSELSGVFVYADGDYIYLKLKTPPSKTLGCKTDFFVISEDVLYERRQMLLSRALMAYASKEVVNIGFDNTGDNCVHGYVRVHRVG